MVATEFDIWKKETKENASKQNAFNERKFYDEETGRYINLQALRRKYKHIANELLYDKLCISEIECAVNESQCQHALINGRIRYWEDL